LDTLGLLNKQSAKAEKRQPSSLGDLREASGAYQVEGWVKPTAAQKTLNKNKSLDAAGNRIPIPPL
jgi:hypothetical protein